MKTFIYFSIALLCIFISSTSFGQAYKLNDNLVVGGNVLDSEVKPDGKYVIYGADKLEDGKPELFNVPTYNGDSVKLNVDITVIQTGGVDYFKVSPDSKYNETVQLY